jgi:hypothetical protein
MKQGNRQPVQTGNIHQNFCCFWVKATTHYEKAILYRFPHDREESTETDYGWCGGSCRLCGRLRLGVQSHEVCMGQPGHLQIKMSG